jgi:hypothetical protein
MRTAIISGALALTITTAGAAGDAYSATAVLPGCRDRSRRRTAPFARGFVPERFMGLSSWEWQCVSFRATMMCDANCASTNRLRRRPSSRSSTAPRRRRSVAFASKPLDRSQ